MSVIPVKEIVQTSCCYCGVGCGVDVEIVQGSAVAVKGTKAHPANKGRLCVKGSALHETQENRHRLLRPQIDGVDVDWDTALTKVSEGFRKIIDEHGPDAVAFYLSGQLLTEDYYVANKLIKGFIGTANVDTNSRLCMASAVVAHKRAFGGDLVPGCYEDLEEAQLCLLVGSNTAYAHPVVYQRIIKSKTDNPHKKIVVLDPRRTATCEAADLHLPLKPGSDAYFFNGLLAYLHETGRTDVDFLQRHCDGFDQTLQQAKLQVATIADVARKCELEESLVKEAYELFASTDRVVTVFSQGINQSSSGVDKGNAIINCHLASGKIGKCGSSPFSITGQPNAMGGREVGGLANQLAAHMTFENPRHRDLTRRFWQSPKMPPTEGLKAVDMFDAVDQGKIKAIWIMATNPVVTMPDADRIKRALQKCELVVVSECVADSDTARLANVLLPATTWGEKTGTVTNSERCISLQKGFLPAPGEARNDWEIICSFARRLGFEEGFNYIHPVEIFREHAALSAFENDGDRGFNIGALADITAAQYLDFRPTQWPVTKATPNGTQRLFTDGVFLTRSGRAQMVPIEARLPARAPAAGEVIMNTGRIRDQWHTMSRTGCAPRLMTHQDEPFIDIHPDDINTFDLVEDELAVLEHAGVRYVGRVKCSLSQRVGEVFVPMHWNAKYTAAGRADALVVSITDPIAGQPEFKHCPVRLYALGSTWNGSIISSREVQPQAEYWTKITVSRGYKYRLAGTVRPDNWKRWVMDQFPEIESWMEVLDSDQQFYRAVGYVDDKVRLTFNAAMGAYRAEDTRWLEDCLGDAPDADGRMSVLAGAPATGTQTAGQIICSCFQVGKNAIENAIHAGCDSVEALGRTLQCGTNCGSCIPELQTCLKACGEPA